MSRLDHREPQNGRTSKTTLVDPSVSTAAQGGAIDLFGSFSQYGLRLVLALILARLMGADQYGLYGVSVAILYLLADIASFGMPSAVTYYVAKHAVQDERRLIQSALITGLLLPLLAGLAISGVLIGLAGPLALTLFDRPELAPLLRLVGLAIPFTILSAWATGGTHGFKRMEYKVIANDVLSYALKLALVIVLAPIGINAWWGTGITVVGEIVAASLLICFLSRIFPLLRGWREISFQPREMLGYALPAYLGMLAVQFVESLQVIVLGAWSSAASAGVFTIASRSSLAGRMFHLSLVRISSPIVSELHRRGDFDRMAHFYRTQIKWNMLANLPMFLCVLVFSKPILSLFGEQFVDGSMALIILAGCGLVDAVTGMSGVVLSMTGRVWLNLGNAFGRLVVLVILDIWLVPWGGVAGAALATGLSGILIQSVRLAQVYVLYRFVPFRRDMLKPLLAGLAAVGATLGLTSVIHPGGDLSLLGFGCVILIGSYTASLLLLSVSDEDRQVMGLLWARLRALKGGARR